MAVNITVVTFNRLALTQRCLSALVERTEGDFTVNIVDNGSDEKSRAWLSAFAEQDNRVRVHFMARNMGVSVAANYGWDLMPSDYYVKLDNDIIVHAPDWMVYLQHILEENHDVAQAGYQLFADHKTEPVPLRNGDVFRAAQCCGGACVMIPRRIHEELGFWCEDYGLYGYEDLEYSIRASLAGYRVGYVDRDGMIEHLEHEAFSVQDAQGSHDAEARYEDTKQAAVKNTQTGEKLFYINKFLFEEKIRPLKVERKYLPKVTGAGIRFTTNPAYMPIIRLQQDTLKKVDYSIQGADVALDLREFR